jgi:anaerobic selenocysteine-containing dehydrogenase
MGKRVNLQVAVGVAIVIAAFGVAAIARSSGPPAWQKALMIRGAALDQRYVHEARVRLPAATPEPDWLRALRLRSNALDRTYGLTDARSSQAGTGPDWYRALMERSDALDRRYHLGAYAASP